MSPQDVADLPVAALLVFLGGSFITLLLTGQLRIKREMTDRDEMWQKRVTDIQTDRDEWKTSCKQAVSTAASLTEQNEKLVETNERLIASLTTRGQTA